MKNIGHLDDVCPYCSSELKTRPQRKKKCSRCGNFIYVRTRPTDRKTVLVTETQVAEIEAQRSKLLFDRKPHLQLKDGFAEEKRLLTQKFGSQLSDNDVTWSLLDKEILVHASSRHWGLYRNTLFEMGELLTSEYKWEKALDIYFEVCYFDLNGCSNYGDVSGIPAEDLLDSDGKQISNFNPEYGSVASGVLQRIDLILEYHVKTNKEEIRDRFLRVAKKHEKSLRLPLIATEAWKTVEAALLGHSH